MEYIVELILDLFLVGSIEASQNVKVPKPLRYLLLILLIMFFTFIIGLIIFLGIEVLNKNTYAGLFLIMVGLFMLITCIIKFQKVYMHKKERKEIRK